MELITKIGKEIKESFVYPFEIVGDGIYLIEIIASAKSWWQNLKELRSFFNDDDLAIKIDGIEFPKLSGKRGLFDGEAAWNGNNLKGLKKIGIFVLNLKSGEHKIEFIADKKPYVESIKISKAETENYAIYISSDENKKAQDGNNRQWINIAIVDLPLQKLEISAKAEKRDKDSDDIKLIIDGVAQQNPYSKKFKNWYWCGHLDNTANTTDIKKEEWKEFKEELNLQKRLHYIEFWADRMPILNKIELNLQANENHGDNKKEKIIQKYDQYQGISGQENYDRFDNEIMEAVDYWNNFFIKQEYPPNELLDYNLVKAIIYRESRIGYQKGGEVDVMQVGDPANPALKTLSGEFEEWELANGSKVKLEYQAEIESPKDSVYWGIRWLYHKAQGIAYDEKRYWKNWEQAVIDYNGSDTKYDYQKKVWQIYKDGTDPDGNILWKKIKEGFSLLLLLILIGVILLVGAGVAMIAINIQNKKESINNVNYSGYKVVYDKPAAEEFRRELEEYKKDKNYYGEVFAGSVKVCNDINGGQKYSCSMEFSVFNSLDEIIENTKLNKQFLEAIKVFDFLDPKAGDIDNDGENEIVFVMRDALNRDFIKISTIDKIDGKFKLLAKEIDAYDGRIELRDLTGDLIPEVVSYITFGRYGYPLFIYQYKNKEFVEILKDERIEFPEYTFSDVDRDGKMEIRVIGEEHEVLHDYRAIIKRIYEYNPTEYNFILIDSETTEI